MRIDRCPLRPLRARGGCRPVLLCAPGRCAPTTPPAVEHQPAMCTVPD